MIALREIKHRRLVDRDVLDAFYDLKEISNSAVYTLVNTQNQKH